MRSARNRSGQELRAIALGVHEGRIITNAQTGDSRWRQYALTLPPLVVEYKRLTRTDLARLQKFTKEIEAWEKGVRA